ncbi:FAD-dependent monooxygenase [Hymenobacter sp. ASUV-10]|uniref:FAD-dependent monooxygenase n=1 Tax=Hymenobacter aranciens TaxID=3063996 RepID=A0ABT9B7Z2_9BACT|nr:FAD-dependent monooxygenase [Hymenobacter sp. ASUV-10]MDO7874402.1 FAD-dependent monooxygenase [Hymenobacter sp. ASUV-10]
MPASRTHPILIAGASIAGPTLAYWLTTYGFRVVVVERAPALRLGGQNIDINGPGRKVVRLMGVEDRIRAANTGELGLQFIGPQGEVAAAFPKDGEVSGTRELEILRGDLVDILYNHTRQDVEYRFGDSIAGLAQQADGVAVTFASGRTEAFQLVVAADGVRSGTRRLAFGNEPQFKYLGLYTAYLTIARQPTDTAWWRWYTAPASRVLMLRPDNHGTTRASVAFLESQAAYENCSPAEQKAVLQAKLAGAGWEADRIRRAIDEGADVYFDQVGQIIAPRWSAGRVALVGDAAYCPSPLTGKGTTLALVGAYVLAGELARHARPEDAFAAYEQKLRPYVTKVQQLPPGVPGLAYPSSKLGVTVLNTLAGAFASGPVQKIVGLFSSRAADAEEDDFTLPDYSLPAEA